MSVCSAVGMRITVKAASDEILILTLPHIPHTLCCSRDRHWYEDLHFASGWACGGIDVGRWIPLARTGFASRSFS